MVISRTIFRHNAFSTEITGKISIFFMQTNTSCGPAAGRWQLLVVAWRPQPPAAGAVTAEAARWPAAAGPRDVFVYMKDIEIFFQ